MKRLPYFDVPNFLKELVMKKNEMSTDPRLAILLQVYFC